MSFVSGVEKLSGARRLLHMACRTLLRRRAARRRCRQFADTRPTAAEQSATLSGTLKTVLQPTGYGMEA